MEAWPWTDIDGMVNVAIDGYRVDSWPERVRYLWCMLQLLAFCIGGLILQTVARILDKFGVVIALTTCSIWRLVLRTTEGIQANGRLQYGYCSDLACHILVPMFFSMLSQLILSIPSAGILYLVETRQHRRRTFYQALADVFICIVGLETFASSVVKVIPNLLSGIISIAAVKGLILVVRTYNDNYIGTTVARSCLLHLLFHKDPCKAVNEAEVVNPGRWGSNFAFEWAAFLLKRHASVRPCFRDSQTFLNLSSCEQRTTCFLLLLGILSCYRVIFFSLIFSFQRWDRLKLEYDSFEHVGNNLRGIESDQSDAKQSPSKLIVEYNNCHVSDSVQDAKE